MNGSDAHLLDAYLDQLLSNEARLAFESGLERDADLRHKVQVQQIVDEALRRLFAPPAVDRVLANAHSALAVESGAEGGGDRSARRPSKARSILGIAAVIVLGSIGAYRLWSYFNPSVHDGRYFRTNQLAMDTIYHNKLADGFRPDWKCESDEEFIRTFKHQLFQPLVLMTAPPGVDMVGLGY
jgi:hypothetical protein